ncbi:MAG TPA: hypothetical protein PLU47_02100 [Azonexus sp.]|nr:hypothetical protein [Azonexus sp.]
MTIPTVAEYLKYANLQMAAEAFIRDPDSGVLKGTSTRLEEALIAGNKHASRFTETEAKTFADQWEVVDQKPNTPSGFSGTLFRNKANPSELVISFRSTEFVDDAVRDNQATNKMEVKEYGWAFGQIADMEDWYTSLKNSGLLPAGSKPTVTGYSLGGHLATAFNQLHPNDAAATYTFNGAGIGDLTGGKTLATVIADFDRMRKNADGQQIEFANADAQALYEFWRQVPSTGWSTLNFTLETAKLAPILLTSPTEALLLQKALGNMQDLYNEATRISLLTDTVANPIPVALAQVGAFDIDYQIALLKAAEYTSAYRTNAVLSGFDAYAERNTRYVMPNFYDIYGANSPSGVANSQWHTGQATPVFIEDQPLYRGAPMIDAAAYSYFYSDIKLLVDNYSTNDFGDTHSLVLIVDSLAVTNALAMLDPNVTLDTAATFFKAASIAKQELTLGSQGKSEGDALEWVLDGLVKLFTNTDSNLHDGTVKNGSSLTTGGTWADETLRKNFYAALAFLNDKDKSAFPELAGKFKLGLPDTRLATAAPTDFASLLTLLSLSPVAIQAKTGEEGAVAAALGAIWADEYAAWNGDRALSTSQRANGGNYTDQYLADRAAFLTGLSAARQANTGDGKNLRTDTGGDPIYFEDKTSGLTLQTQNSGSGQGVSGPSFRFGGTDNDTFLGSDQADHLYGGAGSDTLNGGAGDDLLTRTEKYPDFEESAR